TLAWTVTNAPCAAETQQITVSFLDAVSAPLVQGGVACGPDTVTLNATLAVPGTLNWYSDTTAAPVFTGSSFTTPILSASTTYYVQASNCLCAGEFIEVEAIVDSIPTVSAGMDVQVAIGQSVQLFATGSAANLSYSWTPAANLLGANTALPTALPTETTQYTVYVTTPNGCQASDTVRVGVTPLLVIPNGFTPNGDGKN